LLKISVQEEDSGTKFEEVGSESLYFAVLYNNGTGITYALDIYEKGKFTSCGKVWFTSSYEVTAPPASK